MSPYVTETRGAKVVTTISSRAVMLVIVDSKEKPSGAFLSSEEARKIAGELMQLADEADAVLIPTDEERKIIINHFRAHGKFLRVEDIREGMQ